MRRNLRAPSEIALKTGHALGADRQPVGRVLDVAAGVDAAVA